MSRVGWKRLRVAAFAVVAAGLVAVGPGIGSAQASTAKPGKAGRVVTVRVSAARTGHGSASGVRPADWPRVKCGHGRSSGNVNTCMHVHNNGRYVYNMMADATVHKWGRYLKVCIRFPRRIGRRRYLCSPLHGFVWVRPKPTPPVRIKLHFGQDVPAGKYCANTWQRNTKTSQTRIGHECLRVG